MTNRIDPERLKRQVYWHALPVGWYQLDYDEFCEKRRKLIAKVVEKALKDFGKIKWRFLRKIHRLRTSFLMANLTLLSLPNYH